MDIFRMSLRSDFRDRLRRVLPGVTEADLASFDVLVVRDCLATDDGLPHPELVAWVTAILRRGEDGAVAVPVRPVPGKGPVGAEVVA